MTSMMKSLASAAALSFSSIAGAQTITLQPDVSNGYWLGPRGQVQFTASADLLGALDTFLATVSSVSPASVSIEKSMEGYFDSVVAATPLSALSEQFATDSRGPQIMSVNSAGGLLITTPARKSVSTGGTLTISNLQLDLVTREVYVDVAGANGVGTISHLDLWHAQSIIGPLGFWPVVAPLDCSYPCVGGSYDLPITLELNGLSINANALNVISQSLGLLTLGKAALLGVNDFGTLTVGPVPEASSGLMMALGLIGVAGATLSRRFPFCRHSSLA